MVPESFWDVVLNDINDVKSKYIETNRDWICKYNFSESKIKYYAFHNAFFYMEFFWESPIWYPNQRVVFYHFRRR